jgi:hypothetical protein
MIIDETLVKQRQADIDCGEKLAQRFSIIMPEIMKGTIRKPLLGHCPYDRERLSKVSHHFSGWTYPHYYWFCPKCAYEWVEHEISDGY